MTLQDKAIIVTGAGAGLGLAYAREIARQGASVVVNDVDQIVADSAVSRIREEGGKAVACAVPVGTTDAATLLVSASLKAFGRLDGLVTNAGTLRDKSVLKMSDDDFDSVIQVHLRGTFTCVREAYRHFKENDVQGSIVCIGSPTGQRGNFGQTNYAAAKAGIVGMVRTWALEMKKAGVQINAAIPVASTAMTRTVPYFRKAIEAEDRQSPMPAFFRHDLGFGTAEDVAGLVAYLVGGDLGETGQVLGIGGDRLQVWTHPLPEATEYHDGGWSYDDLARDLPALVSAHRQPVGEEFLPLPEELRPEES
nr:SDR family NAD(P)-dependent oxidoreductase [Kocuria sp. 257]